MCIIILHSSCTEVLTVVPRVLSSVLLLCVTNPWHACAARVTVVGLSACVSVCLLVNISLQECLPSKHCHIFKWGFL